MKLLTPILISAFCISSGAALVADNADDVAAFKKLGGKIEFDSSRAAIKLDLTGIPASDKDLKQLTGLPHLQKLAVWGADVTDAAIAEMKPLKELTDLSLENTVITDAGLAQLKDLPGIKALNLRRLRRHLGRRLCRVKESAEPRAPVVALHGYFQRRDGASPAAEKTPRPRSPRLRSRRRPGNGIPPRTDKSG